MNKNSGHVVFGGALIVGGATLVSVQSSSIIGWSMIAVGTYIGFSNLG